ncbi:DUF418 domain-containing protein [Metabacillus fastidiosus]|uniref:DUF418 domain-containing protein n=1 Tax=Metabacillus fastidiosus TaxID=1458 RepID=UPI002E21CD91|nr:DUF418 domain-containing protein [Metabacillus fastidiosus]
MKYEPIALQNRIVSIDIIRGFALFGIFLVNMPTFHSPDFLHQLYGLQSEYKGIDFWTNIFFQLFVQMKFFPMFSFLFGLGFFIFMNRAKEKGNMSSSLYLRRISFLFVFGIVHLIFLWFGDILHLYAAGGLLLLAFYNRKPKTILIWALSLLILYFSSLALQLLIPASFMEEIQQMNAAQGKEELAHYLKMYTEASYWDWIVYRLGVEVIPILLVMPFSLIPVFAMFLLGLFAGKIRIFETDPKNIVKKIWITTLLAGLPLTIILALSLLSIINLHIHQEASILLFTSMNGIVLCLFYISSLILLLRTDRWRKYLYGFRYSGQMAFTNYIMQTVICQIIFLGFNLYGKVSLFSGTILCIIIYIFQIIISWLWLKKFRFGPLEWLWRSFTYLQIQRLKIK